MLINQYPTHLSQQIFFELGDNMRLFFSKHKTLVTIIAAILALLVIFYCLFVFSSIKFIRKWRNIYIETAMTTMSHQWLATAFIPSSIVNEVMGETEKALEENMIYESPLPTVATSGEMVNEYDDIQDTVAEKTPKELFCETYFEIDPDTLPDDLDYGKIQISDISGKNIKTTSGDTVWAIDEINGIIIVEVKGTDYVGKLAIVKDSSQVILAQNTKSSRGSTIPELCDQYNGVLGINASSFGDEDGTSRGDVYIGYIKAQEKEIVSTVSGYPFQLVGFDYDDNLRVGYGLDTETLRDACQFYPVLISEGENMCTGTVGMGLQPRSAIGQTEDKRTLFLIIDGRRVGYSLGATVEDCAEILLRYDAYTAMNLDGGSSAAMVYMGELITKTSSPMPEGRYLPNAWVVVGSQSETGEQ